MKTTWKHIDNELCEQKGFMKLHNKGWQKVCCPFCHEWTDIYNQLFIHNGKRCQCGAMLTDCRLSDDFEERAAYRLDINKAIPESCEINPTMLPRYGRRIVEDVKKVAKHFEDGFKGKPQKLSLSPAVCKRLKIALKNSDQFGVFHDCGGDPLSICTIRGMRIIDNSSVPVSIAAKQGLLI